MSKTNPIIMWTYYHSFLPSRLLWPNTKIELLKYGYLWLILSLLLIFVNLFLLESCLRYLPSAPVWSAGPPVSHRVSSIGNCFAFSIAQKKTAGTMIESLHMQSFPTWFQPAVSPNWQTSRYQADCLFPDDHSHRTHKPCAMCCFHHFNLLLLT